MLAGDQTSTVTLPFAATYTVPTASGDLVYHTNAGAEDPTSTLSYLFGSQPASYDQSREGPQGMPGTSILATGITDMRIAFAPEQASETSDLVNPGYPFDSYPPDPVPVIENGQNLGFSVFSGLRLRPGLTQSFSFTLNLSVQWRTEGQPEGEWSEDLLAVQVQVHIGSDWQLYGIRHDESGLTGTIVFIYAQYKAAIESGLFDIVYLGFNDGSAGLPPRYVDLNNQAGTTYVNAQPGGTYGTIQYLNDLSFRGVSVPRNMVIDGRDPNLPDKLQHIVESTNSPLLSGRGLNLGTAGLTITLRNVEIKNYNYYGSIYAGSVANTGAVLKNVRWIGNQMAYMYGTDAFIAFDGDCYIEVAQQSTGYAQEVGEIPQVFVRGGTTTIQHGSTSNSVFRRTHTVQVAKGATLNVQCGESFLYRDTFDTAVQVDGTLTLRTGEKTGCFVNANNYLAGMSIGSTGVVRIDHVPISGSSGNASLRTRGLSIAPGGRLEIWRTANSSTSTNAAALYLQSGGSGLSLDNPGRVIVYSASTPVVHTNSSVTASINTDAINLWRNDTNNANDIDNMPTFLWSSDLAGAGTSRTALSVDATLNGARVTALSTSGLGSYNLGNQPVRSDATYANYALNADNLAMSNKGMLVLGRQRMSLDKLPLNGKHVSGITSPSGQAVRLFEYEGDMAGDAFFVDPTKTIPRQVTQTPLSVSGGRFAGDFDNNILTEKTAVFALLQNDYLKSYAYSFMPGYVDFLELPPGDIHFTPLYIDGVDQIACRDDASADIGFAILDTRARPEDPSDPAPEWKLMVRMESYLSTGTYGQPGYYSFDASEKGGLAYVDPEPMYPDYMRRVEEPIRLPYDQTAVEIAASSTQDASSEFPIDWARDAGLVFTLPAYAGQAGDYAGVVVWEIYRGP